MIFLFSKICLNQIDYKITFLLLIQTRNKTPHNYSTKSNNLLNIISRTLFIMPLLNVNLWVKSIVFKNKQNIFVFCQFIMFVCFIFIPMCFTDDQK